MEKITSISQLKKGDRIWTINGFSGAVEVLEFVCIHPYNEVYSIFLNENYDGMPKVYNKNIEDGDYERYDATKECWERIHAKEIAWHERKISNIRNRKFNLR